MYQNPWRLPFAWQSLPELFVLTEQGQEEEQGRGPNQRTVKVEGQMKEEEERFFFISHLC